MLTSWGKKVVACARNGSYYYIPSVSATTTSKAYIEAKTLGGVTVYISPIVQSGGVYNPITSAIVASGSSASVGVAFGSDGTTATENDYKLGSQITGISVPTTPTVETVFDDVNHLYIARLDYAVSNNTGSDITIREIGVFSRFNSTTTRGNAASSSASTRYSIMMDRTVLDSPVTIPNGTAATVRYEFAYEG